MTILCVNPIIFDVNQTHRPSFPLQYTEVFLFLCFIWVRKVNPNYYKYEVENLKKDMAQLAGAVEYPDRITAEG